MKKYSDNFAERHMPHPDLQPDYIWNHPDFDFSDISNCVDKLLDIHIREGRGNTVAIQTHDSRWTFQDLYEKSNQIAHVLLNDLAFQSGNRVLIRSANNPMFVAIWFAVLKAGGIVVSTMPLLREKELTTMIDSAEISHTFCEISLCEDLKSVQSAFLKSTTSFSADAATPSELGDFMANKPIEFQNFDAGPDNIALIGFTSGTTGKPKMTAHYHKDILLICEAFPKYSLQPTPDDIFTGSPPLGFTFGLGGLVLFPFYYGASTFLIEKPSPEILLKAIQDYKITICFTAPTAWRIISTKVNEYDVSSLRKCISAGETLPLKVWEDWYDLTGLKIIDGIGSTEILHIFISSNEQNMRKGATGLPIRGYEAKIVDLEGNEVAEDEPGRLAVRGITGCKYLNSEEKQKEYVENKWNITGDVFRKDKEGYYWFVARGDDMIISSGYNIAAIEVESVLLIHNAILECAVVGVPNEERGMLVCAYLVLKQGFEPSDALSLEIQNWFKQIAAPYKYPRVIHFVAQLPKTETGKIQRFKLKS
ncbi:AMP-binding protein [Flavobacterium sp. SM2513]|uniref:AMP-binding protein n=1 Tax=Flavobacterium sp. SM2513 TaxID=3424766 RepID=UPI003D7FC20E